MPRYRFPEPPASEITPKEVFFNRRSFMTGIAAGTIAGAATLQGMQASHAEQITEKLDTVPGPFSTDEEPNTLEEIKSYNNFYEFGTGKEDPARLAGQMTTRPWTIKVGGLVNNPGEIGIDELLTGFPLEERTYRFRCVEAWSMVIPWVGFPLSDLLARFEPQGSAKYIAFETLVRPEEMPGQRGAFQSIEWPYREGLRMDEAVHPLTLVAVGVYGETMPNQNGAPVRLVVPWKYGFKSIKSIVAINFVEEEPRTTWNMLQPSEYGFYSNVNPDVDHPRWSQASERRIGGGLFAKRIPTEFMNGYGEQVASLYDGMDLRANF
ncbi:MAG: protein-methionine-sulfoxide reductase catalytic subunit MsrP [Pseudomonadota bacterium]